MHIHPYLAKACCADLYQSQLARLILGDTLHPGGLALTNRLGRLMGIQPGQWVADLASGRGISAIAVSRVFHCNVVGVEFGAAAAAEARTGSLVSPASPRCFFVQGDAESPPLQSSSLDAVYCECSMSIFPDKARAVAEAARILRPGGRFGLSDVTVEPGCLPVELGGVLGRVLCLADAPTVEGYIRLLHQGGLTLRHQQDASAELLKLLDDLEAKLGAFIAWQNIARQDRAGLDMLRGAPRLIASLRRLVGEGRLGYWLLVAEKPA